MNDSAAIAPESKHQTEERMYLFWSTHGKNVALTAREFKKSRTTLTRIRARNGWLDRFDKGVAPIVEADTDRTAAANIIDTARALRVVRDSMLRLLVGKEATPPDPTWKDILAALELEMKAESGGITPADGDGRGQPITQINFIMNRTPEENAAMMRKYATRIERLAGIPSVTVHSGDRGNGSGTNVS